MIPYHTVYIGTCIRRIVYFLVLRESRTQKIIINLPTKKRNPIRYYVVRIIIRKTSDGVIMIYLLRGTNTREATENVETIAYACNMSIVEHRVTTQQKTMR